MPITFAVHLARTDKGTAFVSTRTYRRRHGPYRDVSRLGTLRGDQATGKGREGVYRAA